MATDSNARSDSALQVPTPGPWFAQVKYREAKIWRRDPADLYGNGGGVAGDRALASVHLGWFGEDEQGFPVAANARLIAAAPELLEALEAFVDGFDPDKEYDATDTAYVVFGEKAKLALAAIAKARGEVA